MFKEGYVRMKSYKYFNLIVASLDLFSMLYIVYYIYFPKNEELYTYVFLICILYVVIASFYLCFINNKIRTIIGRILEILWIS